MLGNIGSAAFTDTLVVTFELETELGFSYREEKTMPTPYAAGERDTLNFALPFAFMGAFLADRGSSVALAWAMFVGVPKNESSDIAIWSRESPLRSDSSPPFL